jgi:hypothetical protein
VPIEFRNLPGGWMLVGRVATHAQLELLGSEKAFARLERERLKASIDLGHPEPGRKELVITAADVNLPPGIALRRALPSVPYIQLARTQKVRVPVVVPTIGMLPAGLALVDVRPDPRAVMLVLPDGARAPRQVPTEILDLRQMTGSAQFKSKLVLPPDARLPPGAEPAVVVHVEIRKEQAAEQ